MSPLSRTQRIIFAILYAGLVFLVLVLNYERILTSSFHIDESLYTGASQAVLSGDFFLNQYWYDKPILVPWLISIGTLLVGNHQAGWRSAGGMLSLLGLFFWLGIIWNWSRNLKPVLRYFLLLTSFLLFINPFLTYYYFSAFTEPFALFFLLGSVYFASLQTLDSQLKNNQSLFYFKLSSLFFVFSFFCKQTALLWFPLFFFITYPKIIAFSDFTFDSKFNLLRQLIESALFFLKKFIQWTWRPLFVLTFISLLGYYKRSVLGPIFRAIQGTSEFSYNLADRVQTLFQSLNFYLTSFIWPLFYFGIALFSLYFILKFKSILKNNLFAIKKDSSLSEKAHPVWTQFGLLISILIQLVALTQSHGPFFDRYLFFLIPLAYLFLIHSIVFAFEKLQLKYIQFLFMVLLVLCSIFQTFSFSNVTDKTLTDLPPSGLSVSLWEASHTLAKEAIVNDYINDWYRRPYEKFPLPQGQYPESSCPHSECRRQAQEGRFPFWQQYRLIKNDESNEIYLARAQIKECSELKASFNNKVSIESSDRQNLSSVNLKWLQNQLFNSMKIRSGFEMYLIEAGEVKTTKVQDESLCWIDWIRTYRPLALKSLASPSFEITGELIYRDCMSLNATCKSGFFWVVKDAQMLFPSFTFKLNAFYLLPEQGVLSLGHPL